MLGWDGSKDLPAFRRLVEDICAILGPNPAKERRKVNEERFQSQRDIRKGSRPGIILLIIVVLLLLVGALPTWPYSSGWGYLPSGALGLVLLVLIILLVMAPT